MSILNRFAARAAGGLRAFAWLAAAFVAASCTIYTSARPDLREQSGSERRSELAQIKARMAVQYMKQQDFRGALSASDEAVKADPGSDMAWMVRAYVRQELGDLAQAEASYRRALGLKPGSAEINNNFGWFLCDGANRPAESIGYFDRALSDPTYAQPHIAYMNKAVCQGRSGDLAGADDSFRKAETLSPNFAPIYRQKADLYLENGDTGTATQLFNKFQEMAPQMGPDDLYVGWKIANARGDTQAAYDYEAQLRTRYPLSKAMKKILNP